MYCMHVPSISESNGERRNRQPAGYLFYYYRFMHLDADQAVEAVYRSDWGRIVAALIRLVGDFELAEEAAQEAFAAAVDQWRLDGIPEFPRAWIIQTARNKAIDRIRRLTRHKESLESYALWGRHETA